MIWLEEKYIHLLAPRLKLFHRVKHQQWAFRCPVCGDSKKNPSKTRGGIYLPSKATQYVMGCFNCGASMLFSNFLKLQDPYLFNEFIVEKYQATQDAVPKSEQKLDVVEEQQPKKRLQLKELECIADLADDHPAVKYLKKRKITEKHFKRLYFVLRFKKFELEWRGEKVYSSLQDHPRLIIPFFDRQGNITRLSARAFGNEQPKYIFMKVKDNASRVFGLDTVDASKEVLVLEGPLDSLFFDNAIAVGSADLVVPELREYKKVVLVPDNQPRNPEVCKAIRKMVESGYPVCLWNESWGKDINDMILNGHSVDDISALIRASTVSGIAAKLKFNQWIKCSLE